MPDVSLIGEARPHELPLSQKLEVFTRIATVWAAHLTPNEVCLVLWIAANTIGRGKRSGCYSLPQLVNGVPRKDGSGKWTDGTGLSLMTVRRVVASLREKGLIHTSQEERGTRFTLVPTWNPATGLAEESNVLSLNLPRAARRAAHLALVHVKAPAEGDQSEWGGVLREQGGCSERTRGGVQVEHPSKGKPTKGFTYEGKDPDTTASRPVAVLPEVRKRVRPAGYVAVPRQAGTRSAPGNVEPSPRCAAPPPAETAQFDPSQSVVAAIETATAARVAEARKRVDTHGFAVTWRAAFAQAHPSVPCPEWTAKAAGMFKKAVTRNWPESRRSQVHDFIEWAVQSWDVILGAKFAWMRESTPPALPDIEFVARMIGKFQEGWAEREELRWRGTEPGTKQAAYALAKREGITIEVAVARVIAREASQATLLKAETLAIQARRDRDDAYRTAEQTNRATRFTRDNPHPLSRAAQEARAAKPNAPVAPAEPGDDAPLLPAIPAIVFGDFA